MSALAPTLQAFFTERLIGQRQASPHTITAYRDTFRLLLIFTQARTGIAPHRLDIDDVDAALIGAFLDHLEHDRGNSPGTRNHRLAAIRSLYHYAALRHPEHGNDRASPRDPQQAPRPRDRQLPHRARDRRAARSARPQPLDRPPRPRAHHARHPDRAPRLRAHRAALPRR